MTESEIRLPDTSRLIVSSSPHLHKPEDIRRIMLVVILALLPAAATGVVVFGWRAGYVLLVCSAACVLFEHLCCRWRGVASTVGDCSALLTGLLLGLNLPASAPWWLCLIGAVLAIGLGKQVYGGLGYNPFNPALVARAGLAISLPSFMAGSAWVEAQPWRIWQTAQAVTAPTPLDNLKSAGVAGADYLDYFIGNMPGCIGETSTLALLAGGLLLLFFGYIRWQVPVGFIGTVAAISGLSWWLSPETQAPPQFHLLTGGLMLGAWFMATDMVTSPIGKSGALVFGIGCGLITVVIRLWGGFPEGVTFAILFMNALVPLIDRYVSKKPFGTQKKRPSRGASSANASSKT